MLLAASTTDGDMGLDGGIPNAHVGDNASVGCLVVMDHHVNSRIHIAAFAPGLGFAPFAKELIKCVHTPFDSYPC